MVRISFIFHVIVQLEIPRMNIPHAGIPRPFTSGPRKDARRNLCKMRVFIIRSSLKLAKIEFRENPPRGFEIITYEQTERQTWQT
jgi:hypothetical protein